MAEVAVIGTLSFLTISITSLYLGILIPRVPFSDSTPGATLCLPAETTVTGPGRNSRYKFLAVWFKKTYFSAIFWSATATE
ncbi:hypothetical protein COY30_00490 [Candidatus Woesebacteria bacterium CG_4_10_14_0_2_um_filter_44_9]|uniref:Uncharacterized protein n=1 Tax=Candidatus Woesebacteria bacterium CG_4_10_14_0_2_um_filter_44_9 TaxID=1975055 RepID=A0A2M7TIN6_9BACT|nr:MAG: hypothetical protein COY30_00490 [Candidatus Woesebacteria bacterium CG_4_10_14_0_2_um_filter_44_9]